MTVGSPPGASRAPAESASGESAGSERENFLGRYRVAGELGVGGMATVHLARADGPGGFQKWVAIKRIHQHLAEDSHFIKMFLDEARIAARISHPNVAQVFDLGKHKGTYWLAMEYLHGEALRDVVRSLEDARQRMPPPIAARIVADAAEGLHSAHEQKDEAGNLLGLVHRDVSPHNLFVTYDGTVKVVDFGVAKVKGQLADTGVGKLKGKVAYMSPEQVGGQPLDRRSDVFALGIVLWELTTQRRLFRAETDLETLDRVLACQVPRPSSFVPGYPGDLEQIVLRALAKAPAQRFQTAREMSRALQHWVMRSGVIVGNDEVAAYLREVLASRFADRQATIQRAEEATRTVALDEVDEFLPDEEFSLYTATGAPRRATVASATPASGPRLGAPLQGSLPMPPRDELPSYDDDDDASTAIADVNALQIPPPPRAPRTLLGMPQPRPTPLPAQKTLLGISAPPAPPAPPRSMPKAAPAPPSRTPAPPRAASRAPTPTPPPASLPSYAAGGAAYGDDDDAVTRIRASPLEFHVHEPPKKAELAPVPHAPVVVSEPAPAATSAPQLTGVPTAPPEATTPRWMVALIAIATTLIALCLVALVVLRLTEKPRVNVTEITTADQGGTVAPAAAGAPPTAVAATGAPAAATTPQATDLAALPLEHTSEKEAKALPTPAPVPHGGLLPAPLPAPAAAPSPAAETAAPAAPAAAGPGFLTIVCDPFCDAVLVDGKNLGPSPVVRAPLKPGSHSVVLRKAGAGTKSLGVSITSGQTSAQRVKMGS